MGSIRSFSRDEKIGNDIFPVTYFDNGIVIIDYPRELLCKKLTEESKENVIKIGVSIRNYMSVNNLVIQFENTDPITINKDGK